MRTLQNILSFLGITKKELTPGICLKEISKYKNISRRKLVKNTRKREIAEARQIAMFFAVKYVKTTLINIANQIGNKKQHGTVIHACKTINNLYETNRQIRNDVDRLEMILLSKYKIAV